MPNLLIRNVSPDTLQRIQADAERQRRSQNDILLALIERHYGEPPVVVAWLKATRNGELPLAGGSDEEPGTCLECGQDLDWPWVGILSDGTLHMPVCSGCATSE